MVGKTLGHYEILEPLGAGGMGQVYRAHDTNLKRDVAIKVLPEELAADDARLARLEREAHLLASLNHPNVAAIYNLEESDGVRWLVLELVEGENLEQRLRSGRLPLEDALATGRQVAVALDAAHKQGIVHRDLKPANVMLDAEGVVKVLDFGIAKAPLPASGESTDGSGNEKSQERSPRTQAVTSAAAQLTATGMLVGTAPYMSPEQIRGNDVDKRSDIWAFGCLMFELLSGQRPFHRETMADTLGAILENDPDWKALPSETPACVRELVQRCLKKDADMRLQDIADGRVAIDEASESGAMSGATPSASSPVVKHWNRKWAMTGIVAMLLVGSIFVAYLLRPDEPSGVAWPQTLTMKIGGGTYGLLSAGIADLIEQEVGIDVERFEWGQAGWGQGSPEILMRAIDSGTVDLSFTQNDTAHGAVNTGDFLGHRSTNITGVTVLYSEPLHIVVRSDGGITEFDGLRGNEIFIGEGNGAGSSLTFLSHFGIEETSFVAKDDAELGASGGDAAALSWLRASTRAGAVMKWGAVPTVAISDAFREGELRLLPIDPDAAAGLRLNVPFFKPTTIPSTAYPGQMEAVPTVAVTALLVAGRQLPDDLVERILEVMFANIPVLIARHPQAAEISVQTAFGLENGMTIKLHPGAEAFREAHAEEINGRR